MSETRVEIIDLVGGCVGPVEETLRGLGFDPAAGGNFSLVVVEDYLQPGLIDVNRRHLEAGRPWMLVKPHGFVTWVGPIFVPGRTGCWECLAQRLRNNREVEGFIERKTKPGPFPVSRSRNPASFRHAIDLASLHVAIFAGSGGASPLVGMVVTTCSARCINETHTVSRRPQCAACGEPTVWKFRDHVIALRDSGKAFIQDGGHRSVTPEATYERFKHLVSPVTGVVSSLQPFRDLDGGPLRVYIAGHNFALKNDSLYFIREGLRTNSMGKGVTDAQAHLGALRGRRALQRRVPR